MMRFFSRMNSHTVRCAKNRLKSVIINDRMNVSYDMTIEKMRKEVSAVLEKYAPKNAQPQVSVTCSEGLVCLVNASLPLKKERDNIR